MLWGDEGYEMFHVKHFERKIGDEIGEVRRECVWGTEEESLCGGGEGDEWEEMFSRNIGRKMRRKWFE